MEFQRKLIEETLWKSDEQRYTDCRKLKIESTL